MGFFCSAAKIEGVAHKLQDIGCEDACGVWEDGDRGAYAIVVADGHGDPMCVRSALGSQIAVEVALGRLELAAEALNSVAEKRDGADAAREVAVGIVDEWRQRVLQDLAKRPMEPSETEGLDASLVEAWEERPEVFYGTTLVAALLLPRMALFIQQGDGSCCMLSTKGEVSYPIPEDDMCVGNLTTSLCDSDADERIRSVLVAYDRGDLAGCFVATDGVDKSYSSIEGFELLLNWIVNEAQDKEANEMADALVSSLDELSARGSRDDASLSCVVRDDLSCGEREDMRKSCELRSLTSELREVRERLASMQRKHAMLEKRWNSGEKELAQEYPEYHDRWELLVRREALIEESRRALAGEERTTTDNDV